MNAFVPLPSQFRWTPHQLAGAMPLHLRGLFAFDAARDGGKVAANEPRQRLRIAHGYRAATALAPRFRIS
ncbi:MAG: hypothetical protein EOP93_02015 [Lysobacteraceae bacterium]|nr:MAG: hypothetical protein EOP93_02015 [Xanthomonadaceae bacterium]